MPTRKDNTNVAPIYREQVFIPFKGAKKILWDALPKINGQRIASGAIDIVSPEFDLLTGIRGIANLPKGFLKTNKLPQGENLYYRQLDKSSKGLERAKQLGVIDAKSSGGINFTTSRGTTLRLGKTFDTPFFSKGSLWYNNVDDMDVIVGKDNPLLDWKMITQHGRVTENAVQASSRRTPFYNGVTNQAPTELFELYRRYPGIGYRNVTNGFPIIPITGLNTVAEQMKCGGRRKARFGIEDGVPTQEEYIAQQIAARKAAALDKSRNRTEPTIPLVERKLSPEEISFRNRIGYAKINQLNDELIQTIDNKQAANIKKEIDKELDNLKKTTTLCQGASCIYTATDNYGKQYRVSGNQTFAANPSKYGFKEVSNDSIQPSDIVQFVDRNVPYHAVIYDSKDDKGENLYNYSDGGYGAKNIKIKKHMPGNNYKTYTFVGTPADSIQWINEYKQKYGNGMRCGGRRKAQLGLDIREGGIAIPIAPNMYYMDGRSHDDGGIAIGPNNKNGLEVEGGEVVKIGNNDIKVFSSVPLLRGVSPAQLVMGGANPNKVFKAQEEFKDRNRINDDGTTYELGGDKIINIKDVPSSFRGKLINGRYVQYGIPPAVNKAKPWNTKFKDHLNSLNTEVKTFATELANYGKSILPKPIRKYYAKGINALYNSAKVEQINSTANQLGQISGILDEYKMGGNKSNNKIYDASGINKRKKIAKDILQILPFSGFVNDVLDFTNPINGGSAVKSAMGYGMAKAGLPFLSIPGIAYNGVLGLPDLIQDVQTLYKDIKTPKEEFNRKKKKFGGSMLYTINGNVKNGLMSARPKAQYGKEKKINANTKIGEDGLIYTKAIDGDWYTDGTRYEDSKYYMGRKSAQAYSREKFKRQPKPQSLDEVVVTGTKPKVKEESKPITTSSNNGNTITTQTIEGKQVDYPKTKTSYKPFTYKKDKDGKLVKVYNDDKRDNNSYIRPNREGANYKPNNYNPLTGETVDEHGIVKTSEPSVKGTTKVSSSTSSTPRGRGTKASKSATSTKPATVEAKQPKLVEKPKENLYITGIKNNAVKSPLMTGMEKISANPASSSTGGETQPKDGRWVGQYKTTNVGDWIGLGSNLTGTIASYFMTKNAINKMPDPIKPVMAQAAKLKTRYNIEPQLTNIREGEQMNRASVRRNTQSSNTSLVREQRLMNKAIIDKNQLYGQKEINETQWINQDRLNRQTINAQNVATYNDYLTRLYAGRVSKNEARISNVNNLISGLTGSVNSILGNIESRRATNNTIRAIAAANPNVDARLIGGFDYYIDPITKKKYNKNQQLVGTING